MSAQPRGISPEYWYLNNGLRIAQPMTLISKGLCNELPARFCRRFCTNRHGRDRGGHKDKPGLLQCPPRSLWLNVGKNLGDLQNRIPITVRGWNTKEFLDSSEITDRFHMAAIHTQDEPVSNRNDLQQPIIVGRQTKKERRRRANSFG